MINPKVTSRNDELGDLARYSIQTENTIKNMIGKDPLTGLYNRRTGRQFLDLFWQKSHEENSTFSLAMGDIDFFKNQRTYFPMRRNCIYNHNDIWSGRIYKSM